METRSVRGASTLIDMQQPDGSWRATWYVGPAYGTGLAVRLLREIAMGEQARTRAHRFLLEAQREHGGWSDGSAVALQTALSMAALSETEPGRRRHRSRGRRLYANGSLRTEAGRHLRGSGWRLGELRARSCTWRRIRARSSPPRSACARCCWMHRRRGLRLHAPRIDVDGFA